MTREQRADVAFWRKAERAFLRPVNNRMWKDRTRHGICFYVLKSKYIKYIYQLRQIRNPHVLWGQTSSGCTPSGRKNRLYRAMCCGLIAAMIETGDM